MSAQGAMADEETWTDEPLVTVLGPTTVAGEALTARQRSILAALVLHRGRGITTELLIDAVWSDDVPRAARQSLQNQITRLRRRFGADLVVTDGSGYRLGWATDVGRFDLLATTWLAREASPGAIRPLEAACAMWHGTPYVDLAELPAVEPERARIAELRAAVADRLAMSRLVAGDVRRAVTELVVLAEEDPYRECRWELLMRALDRDQRQGEAIAVYERLADRLANDLGVRPSEPLQRLRLDIQSGATALSERELEPFTTEELRREDARRHRCKERPLSCGPSRPLFFRGAR